MSTSRVGPGGGRRSRFAVTTVPLKPAPTTTIVRSNAGKRYLDRCLMCIESLFATLSVDGPG